MRNETDRDCISALELFQYINSDLPESQTAAVTRHLDACETCSEVVRNLKSHMMKFKDDSREMYRRYQVPDDIARLANQCRQKSLEAMERIHPKEISFGQLWSTRTVAQTAQESLTVIPRIVAILGEQYLDDSYPSTIVVAPISLELEFQSRYDLTVFEEESPLGYQFMIEVWNQTTTLVSQLDSYVGPLVEHLKDSLRLLNEIYLGLADDSGSLSDRIGWPILHDNDPRALFQAQEVEESKYLREPALREVAIAERTPVAALKDYSDIWFRREDGSLYFADLKESELLTVAAPSRTARNWFLHAKKTLLGEEIIARFVFHLLQDELELRFERIPQVLVSSELLVKGYGKSRAVLFSETIRAEQYKSFVVSKHQHVSPYDIEELNVSAKVAK